MNVSVLEPTKDDKDENYKDNYISPSSGSEMDVDEEDDSENEEEDRYFPRHILNAFNNFQPPNTESKKQVRVSG